MARRRMFSMDVIDTDAFIDMPCSARLLYFDLGMRADDDGFLQSAQRILRTTGASRDDMNVLISRGFVIPFDSGVVVIRHWKQNNEIKKDRYKPTVCLDEFALLSIDKAKKYELHSAFPNLPPAWNQTGDKLEPQYSIGEGSIDKGSIELDDADVEPQLSDIQFATNLRTRFSIELKSMPDLLSDMRKHGRRIVLQALTTAAKKNTYGQLYVNFYRKFLPNVDGVPLTPYTAVD